MFIMVVGSTSLPLAQRAICGVELADVTGPDLKLGLSDGGHKADSELTIQYYNPLPIPTHLDNRDVPRLKGANEGDVPVQIHQISYHSL